MPPGLPHAFTFTLLNSFDVGNPANIESSFQE